MKTEKLIELLMEADPSGKEEVCVGNEDIHFVQNMPAYYDGCLQKLKRNEEERCYNIVGAEYVSGGSKINIHTLSIEDAILNDTEIPVDFDHCHNPERYMDAVEGWRQEMREIDILINNEEKT